MPKYSRYSIVIDNISSGTRTSDLEYEFKYAGRIRRIERDHKYRMALIEYDRSADAEYAYRKMHNMVMNGRDLKVDYATRSDYKVFGWKWVEDTPSPSPVGRGRSRSVSRSRSRSRSVSRSRTPPVTPHNKDDQREPGSDSGSHQDKDSDKGRRDDRD